MCFCLATDLHGGADLVVHSGHPPHTITHLIHEYHVNITQISMSFCGFHGMAWVAKKETYNVFLMLM